jgi:DNA-binding NtrC family response regulator
MIGSAPSINQLRQSIDKVAPTNSRVLIVGPPGAGKELTARALHALSGRTHGPFVVINAAAITPGRMEIELFGVEQTDGEQARKVGALEEAHGGTLFIDEITDMPRETQSKIRACWSIKLFACRGDQVAVDVRIIIHQPQHRVESAPADSAILSSAFGSSDPGTVASRAARGYSAAGRPSWSRSRMRPVCTTENRLTR